jgi:hypothetical protein
MAGRQQTAPLQQRRSKDATAQPHQPGARPKPPYSPTQPTATVTTHPKPKSGPHYGTEFSLSLSLSGSTRGATADLNKNNNLSLSFSLSLSLSLEARAEQWQI